MGNSLRSDLLRSNVLRRTIGAFACLIPFAACAVSLDGPATPDIEPDFSTATVNATVSGIRSEADAPTGQSTANVLQILADCHGFDPAIDDSIKDIATYGVALVSEVFSGLTSLTGDSSQPFRNELLAGYSVSDDGLVYELALRSNLKFSDGSALTAADVKWSWERAWLMSVSGGRARDVFGNIRGTEVGRKELPGVQVVDDRNLVVTFTAPVPDFPMLLADPVAAVVKQENVAQWGAVFRNGSGSTVLFRDHITQPEKPIGAGPFAYSDFDLSNFEECSLVRNPHYHGSPVRVDEIRVISYRQILEDSRISAGPEELTFGQHLTAQTRAFNELDIDFMLLPSEAVEDGDTHDSGVSTVTQI